MGYSALTEKEKQTLRLILVGHDAKSSARELGLSVHTINERLRDARRKLGVSSSREAARIVLAQEGGTPKSLGDKPIGEDGATAARAQPTPSQPSGRPKWRFALIGGGLTVLLSLLLWSLAPSAADHPHPAEAVAPIASDASEAARKWLDLASAGRWAESYAATATHFRSVNTLEQWQAAAENVHGPLGPAVERKLIEDQHVPAPPNGYQMVRFRTRYATRTVTETVAMVRENGLWKVTGATVE